MDSATKCLYLNNTVQKLFLTSRTVQEANFRSFSLEPANKVELEIFHFLEVQ